MRLHFIKGKQTKLRQSLVFVASPNICTCASEEPGSTPESAVVVLGVVADELQFSKSERSSLDVALEQVSKPLSVVVGLEIDEPALSEAGMLEVDKPGSMKETPPNRRKSHVMYSGIHPNSKKV